MTVNFQNIDSPEELPTHGVFEAEGLSPGMGTVVGTAMRRVLLSSVPGGAAVWMSIEGVTHEFSTVPGVKEDVQELILRMRGLRLRVRDRAVHTLSLHVKGRSALAGDFHGDSSVEILNPLYPIATLNENGNLDIRIWVRAGRDRGIASKDVPPDRDEGIPMGMLWLDPIHSPVERVAVQVEEESDSEKLRLEVQTNGTVSPREAVDWAGRILAEITGSIRHALAGNVEPIPLLRPSAGRRLEELELSNRSYNRLKRAHFDTVEEILSRSRQELYETPALGPKTLAELEKKLADRGLRLRNNAG